MKIEELKQIVESAAKLPPRRLKIIYSNTEFRLKDLIGIKAQHVTDLENITHDCINLIDDNKADESYNIYVSRLMPLLDTILSESVLIKAI